MEPKLLLAMCAIQKNITLHHHLIPSVIGATKVPTLTTTLTINNRSQFSRFQWKGSVEKCWDFKLEPQWWGGKMCEHQFPPGKIFIHVRVLSHKRSPTFLDIHDTLIPTVVLMISMWMIITMVMLVREWNTCDTNDTYINKNNDNNLEYISHTCHALVAYSLLFDIMHRYTHMGNRWSQQSRSDTGHEEVVATPGKRSVVATPGSRALIRELPTPLLGTTDYTGVTDY